MKRFALAAAAVLAAVAITAVNTVMVLVLALCAAAAAQDATGTAVQIPVAEWIDHIGNFISPVLVAAVLWLIRKLPAQIASILMNMRVDQLLQKAIDYGINATKGATDGKPLTIDVGNQVLATAVQYAVTHGPGTLLSWIGGEGLLREKIIARLNLEADAEVVTIPAPPPATAAPPAAVALR